MPESFSKTYTRAEFNEYIQNIINDVDQGNYLNQNDLEDEAKFAVQFFEKV